MAEHTIKLTIIGGGKTFMLVHEDVHQARGLNWQNSEIFIPLAFIAFRHMAVE